MADGIANEVAGKGGWRRRLRWWHVPVLGFVLLLAVWGGWRVNLRWQIDAELARIRAAGYPVTPAELDAWYAYPEGENAADVYAKAFAAMVEPTAAENPVLPIVGEGELPPVGEVILVETLAAMEVYLERNAEAVRLLHEAGKVEGCRWPMDFGQGVEMLSPHYGPAREAAQLMQTRVIFLAMSRQTHATAQILLDMLSLAESFADEPLDSSQMMRRQIDLAAIASINFALSRIELRDSDLRLLMDAIASRDLSLGLRRAMVGGRCIGWSLYSDKEYMRFASGLVESIGGYWLFSYYGAPVSKLTGVWQLDQLAYLRKMDKILVSVTPPEGYDRQSLRETIDRIAPAYFMASLTMPVIDSIMTNYLKYQTSLDVMSTIISF